MKNSFTLIEVLVVVGVLVILLAISVPAFKVFYKESDLNNSVEEIINALRLAQSNALASEGASQYGVYFSTTTLPQQYILFKGASYGTRTILADVIYSLPESVEIYQLDFDEAVFEKITGKTIQSGKVYLRLKDNLSKTKSIYVEKSGQIGLVASVLASDENRIKDSRHIHIDYGRIISVLTEKIVLTFESGTTKTIIIADNMAGNQIFWEGEVDVAGSIQKIKIHTHRLNGPDTQFSIHRDRRYNTKPLKIDIDDAPDPDPGTLLEYSADGLTTTSTSLYVTNFQWQ
ncbi:MAG: hypothetical protein Q7S82_02140 [bacterium]|nr:hypothetical protein [bacterium]